MVDEEMMDKALRATRRFKSIRCMFFIPHPAEPRGILEVDNATQEEKTLFISEGKSKNKKVAIKQLKILFKAFMLFKSDLVNEEKLFDDYYCIRLFYYSIKRRELQEFDKKGKSKSLILRWNDFEELVALLKIL